MESIDTSVFKNLGIEKLREIEKQLIALKKDRHKKYISPQQKQHLTPLREKYIKPLYDEHIAPIKKALKELRSNLPSKSEKKYWKINNTIIGPISKKDLIKKLIEIPNPNTR